LLCRRGVMQKEGNDEAAHILCADGTIFHLDTGKPAQCIISQGADGTPTLMVCGDSGSRLSSQVKPLHSYVFRVSQLKISMDRCVIVCTFDTSNCDVPRSIIPQQHLHDNFGLCVDFVHRGGRIDLHQKLSAASLHSPCVEIAYCRNFALLVEELDDRHRRLLESP